MTPIETPAKSKVNKYEDPNNPLYLHHSDQPRAVLVTHQLDEENYSTRSHAITMALSSKNKEGFINDIIWKPSATSTTEIQQWTRCNNLLKSWLLNLIPKDIGASVIYNEGAYEIWTELKERFSHRNNIHLFQIE